jgi:hypothetical protein
MATDAAAAVDPPASKGCPAMKAEFAKHAAYLNALVRCIFSHLLPLLAGLALRVLSLPEVFSCGMRSENGC